MMLIKRRRLINSGGAATLDFYRSVPVYCRLKWRAALRFYSDRKVSFLRSLTARHIGVIFFELAAKKLLAALKDLEDLETEFKDVMKVSMETEIQAYNISKKFTLTEKEVTSMIDKEVGHLDDIIATLASKPSWITKPELKEILEDFRPIVASFLSTVELLRVAGTAYLDGKDLLWEFSRANRISAYCADAKSAVGLLSLNIKKNLRYLSTLLKEVQ